MAASQQLFDGLIAEPPCSANGGGGEQLERAIAAAQEACLARGWCVNLVEKPLRGRQDEPVRAVDDARAAVLVLEEEGKAEEALFEEALDAGSASNQGPPQVSHSE